MTSWPSRGRAQRGPSGSTTSAPFNARPVDADINLRKASPCAFDYQG
jgi:hypothetical protein